MRRAVVLIALAQVLGGCSSSNPEPAPAPSATVTLPDGWRWESYRGVEVAVPGEWGTTNASQRIGQWCVTDRGGREPAIGRPGPTTLVGCLVTQDGETPPSPSSETLIKNTGTIVAFEDAVLSDGTKHPINRGGDREVVRVGDVYVIVQVAQPLRDRIAATVRKVDVDANSCPAADPVSRDVERRPASVDVAGLRNVRSVSACRYELARRGAGDIGDPTLTSSITITDHRAVRLVRQIADAPRGGGPDSPQNCRPEDSYGTEIIVLRITSASRVSSVHVRYSGCDHHGFDDGVHLRALQREPLATVTGGANAVGEWDGDLYAGLFGGTAKS
ncbi:MAG: hypothetical protein JWP31_966 [Aeromicrobium sp.]|nr:hypothetical protein [Aeromicrobium sp.]